MSDDENRFEVSEDEDCRVTVVPADDGGAYIEIEMTDELAELFDLGAAALGMTQEEYFRYRMNSPGDDDEPAA
ncbi:MAG: hypothetical protein AB7E80_01655 [Hyphomicrobiaceae bacterium]